MLPDQERINEVRAWLVKAGRDLRMARLAQAAKPPMRDQSVYHAQQAAEKAMKGFLSWHDRPFRKTHNLIEIGEPCAAIDASLESLLRRAVAPTHVCISTFRLFDVFPKRSPLGRG